MRLPAFLPRTVTIRPRFFIAAAVVAIVAYAVPGNLPLSTRFLLGWVAGASVYLALSVVMMRGATAESMRRRAAEADESALLFLFVTIGASAASVVAIVAELSASHQQGGHSTWEVALVFTSLALSWLVIHTVFTVHYAHLYYLAERKKPLVFPGDPKEPRYDDFAYFSGTIGAALQTSDVQVADRHFRRLVLFHSVLSFAFNTTILALAINIAASG